VEIDHRELCAVGCHMRPECAIFAILLACRADFLELWRSSV
jgi:hypothetical protein